MIDISNLSAGQLELLGNIFLGICILIGSVIVSMRCMRIQLPKDSTSRMFSGNNYESDYLIDQAKKNQEEDSEE